MFSIHRIMKVFSQGHPIQVCIQFNLFPRLMQTIDHGNPENLLGLYADRQGTHQFTLGFSGFRLSNHGNDVDA